MELQPETKKIGEKCRNSLINDPEGRGGNQGTADESEEVKSPGTNQEAGFELDARIVEELGL